MTDTPDTAPCKACPWRLTNQGKRHPDGWYTKANLARLWARLRRGEDMSCHPTDPNNPVSEQAQTQGYRPAPDHARIRECTGSLILRQREVVLLDTTFAANPTAYRRARPFGLTRDGIAAVITRAAFGGTIIGGPPMPRPNLNEPDIGHQPLGEWTPPATARRDSEGDDA